MIFADEPSSSEVNLDDDKSTNDKDMKDSKDKEPDTPGKTSNKKNKKRRRNTSDGSLADGTTALEVSPAKRQRSATLVDKHGRKRSDTDSAGGGRKSLDSQKSCESQSHDGVKETEKSVIDSTKSESLDVTKKGKKRKQRNTQDEVQTTDSEVD